MGTKITREDFIARAILKHGKTYDYSGVEYVDSKALVQIICPTHGPFMQAPSNHLAGKGCRKCASQAAGDRYRKSGDSFIEQARQVHSGLYDYSDTDYKTARLKVTIRCAVHGPFGQVPYVHLKGAGCPLCSNAARGQARRTTQAQFVLQAREKYEGKFDYQNTQYVDAWSPVTIGCPMHGAFIQTPAAHLHNTSYGCPNVPMRMQQIGGAAHVLPDLRIEAIPLNLSHVQRSNTQVSTAIHLSITRRQRIRWPLFALCMVNSGRLQLDILPEEVAQNAAMKTILLRKDKLLICSLPMQGLLMAKNSTTQRWSTELQGNL